MVIKQYYTPSTNIYLTRVHCLSHECSWVFIPKRSRSINSNLLITRNKYSFLFMLWYFTYSLGLDIDD